MGKNKSAFWRLFIPLLFWGILAVAVLLLPPLPKESDGLSSETWSYYSNGAPLARQILRYRNELVFLIVICAAITEIVFFILEKRKQKAK